MYVQHIRNSATTQGRSWPALVAVMRRNGAPPTFRYKHSGTTATQQQQVWSPHTALQPPTPKPINQKDLNTVMAGAKPRQPAIPFGAGPRVAAWAAVEGRGAYT